MAGKEGKEIAVDILLFLVTILFISFFYQNVFFLTVFLFIVWLIALKFWHGPDDIAFFVIAAIVGPLMEIIAISFGVWSYAVPTAFGIPLWLPLAWGLAIVLIKRMAEPLAKEVKAQGKSKKQPVEKPAGKK